jgi:hypothetical protein
MKIEILSLTYMELSSADITNLLLLSFKRALQRLLSTLPLIVTFFKIIVCG